MTDSVPPWEATRHRTARQVQEWKTEVQTFFRDDWNRLRQLIMQLEEQTWYPGPASGSGSRPGDGPINHEDTVPDLSSAARELRLASQRQVDESGQSSDRLVDLSRRIEQQLRINHRRRQ